MVLFYIMLFLLVCDAILGFLVIRTKPETKAEKYARLRKLLKKRMDTFGVNDSTPPKDPEVIKVYSPEQLGLTDKNEIWHTK